MVGLSDGDPVGTWEDSSPNNKDATQSTASFRPVYETDIVNGMPAIHFDGTDDRLVSPSNWGMTNHFTVFAVVRLDPGPGTGGQDVVGSSAFANNLDLIARRDEASGNWLAYSSSQDGARNSDLVLSPGTWYVLTWRLRANSPKHLQIRANKIYRLNDTDYTGIGTGSWLSAIGGRQNGVHPLKGDIAEVIFYTNSLSDADMEASEDYLLAKYGLAEPPPSPPAAPTGLTATTIDHQGIDLGWTDNATDEDGVRIERRLGQTGAFETIATLGADVASHGDASLDAETEYCYRAVVFNAGGDSDPSNVACASTSSPPPAPGPSGDPAPGYVAWFKADAIPGLNDGDPVGAWDDSGPNHQDAIQSSASLQPVYETSVVGGRPVVRFDGVDDRLVSPGQSGVWGLTSHFTVFAVVRLDASPGTGGHDVVGSSAISNNLDLFARRGDTGGNWLAYSSSHDGAHDSDLVLSPGTWHVLTWRLEAFEHLQIRADKVYHLDDTGYAGTGTAPSQAAIGARQNGVHPFKGDIAEVIFYTNSLSDIDMATTEDYLLQKYGLGETPAAPTELEASGTAYFRIGLTWMDNADNEDGYRIERRDGPGGAWEETATVGADLPVYHDQSPPLPPETEYCYRVTAFNTLGPSAPSNEACATTLSVPVVQCYSDPEGEQRTALVNILTNPSPVVVEWKDEVGLALADPGQLQLITDDSICQQIWDGIGTGYPPDSGPMATFFQLGDRYIVADYPLGTHSHTYVADQEFNPINPVLVD